MKPPSSPERALLFEIEGARFALPLSVVERVVHAVAITVLPEAPDLILGVINVHGEIAPVFNMRRRLGFPDRELALEDQFILARSRGRLIVLIADSVREILELSELEIVKADVLGANASLVDGVIKMEDGLALLQDLEVFLSLDENRRLDEALASREC